jgi:hypothetical protein
MAEEPAEKTIFKPRSCAGVKAQLNGMYGLGGTTKVVPCYKAPCAAFFSKP